MTVLFSQENIVVNLQGSTISFSDSILGLNDIPLRLNNGANWSQETGHSIYNVVYVDGNFRAGLNFGPENPLILLIEKSTDFTNSLLKIHEFELSDDRLAAIQNSGAVSTTPVGLIALEQYYDIDLNKNNLVSKFGVAPAALIQTPGGDYAVNFGEFSGINEKGLPTLLSSTGGSWTPTRGNQITGIFAERNGSAQIISVIENSGSTFSPAYKKWAFNLDKDANFATAVTTFSVDISSAQLGALETRKNIDFLADGVLGDPIASIIVQGGDNPIDSNSDGFVDGTVTAPSIILTNSNAYAFDLSGKGKAGETPTSLFLEASNGANWQNASGHSIVGGYVSYDVNASSEQTTSAFLYEMSASGSIATLNEWYFLQGSASGVATATSGIAQTILLTDVLTKELELGFDLNGDNVVGDRVVELVHQLPVPLSSAASVVKLASGNYAVDVEGKAAIGQLKPVVNLKTSGGQSWEPSQSSEIIGIYLSEELESSSTVKNYATLFEQSGLGEAGSYKKWIFSKPSSQAYFQASSTNATTVTLNDILIDEAKVRFDLNSDGSVGDEISKITWQVKSDNPRLAVTSPQLVELRSGAYGLDIDGDLSTGTTTSVILLNTSSGANWVPSGDSTVTGVYLSVGGTTASPINLSTIVEKSGSSNFPTFKTWTFADNSDSSKALATTTVTQSITESALLEKELEFGYDLNGDLIVGNGIFSIALLSREYVASDNLVKKTPGVVRLASGDFAVVFEGNDYSPTNGRSFLLKEIASNGNSWSPYSSISSDGFDYFISGAERLDNGDLKLYELRESDTGDPDVRMTTFSLSGTGSQIYFVKDNNSDAIAISDADFYNRELDLGFNLDSNTVLGPGTQEVSISPKAYLDNLNVIQKSPAVAKLSDGSVAVDFTGNVQLGDSPKMILNQGSQLFRYSGTEVLLGAYTSSDEDETTNQITFNVNVVQNGPTTDSDAYYLRSFSVLDDTSASYDTTKAMRLISKTEIHSKEEALGYDLDNNGLIGFQNRELLMPAYIASPGPDDFRLVKTDTQSIGLDSEITLTPESDQNFYSLYDSTGKTWELNNETVTGIFLEERVVIDGENAKVQLRTESAANTVLGVVTNPSTTVTSAKGNSKLWEFVISGDAAVNALGLYEFKLISALPASYSFDELSIVEADKGFDLTGDRQLLGDTAVELFRKQLETSETSKKLVSAELTNLPDSPNIDEVVSELLMPGVSLQSEKISYGNLTSGLKKGTINSFLSNGEISLNFASTSGSESLGLPATQISINAQVELTYYSMDEPLLDQGDFIHFVALADKSQVEESYEAVTEFTNILQAQGNINEEGSSVIATKLKMFDFSENDPDEIEPDEIIMQLSDDEGVILVAPEQTSGKSTFVNLENALTASASEILLLGNFTIRGGAGKQTVIGDNSEQDLSLFSGDDMVFAGGGDDFLTTSRGENYLDGGAGNDQVIAGPGADILVGGAGDDILNGGDGFDTAKYVGSFYDFDINKQLDSYSVRDRLSLEGTDTLTEIERLEFADGTLAFDIDGNAGQAYRLYQAAFERTPDPIGVGYHVNDIESNGLILYQVANNFLASPEFESTYGSDLNDSDFVDALYDNVLGRSPEEFEREYYLDRFNRSEGDPLWMDRAASLIGFSESPENMNIVNDDILNGIWMTNDYM